MTWRGTPLVSYRTIIELLSASTIANGSPSEPKRIPTTSRPVRRLPIAHANSPVSPRAEMAPHVLESWCRH
jgi:hypothetical protein